MNTSSSSYSAEVRARHLKNLEKFDGSIVEYARQNDLNERHIYSWKELVRRKEKKNPDNKKQSSFAKAKIAAPIETSSKIFSVNLRTKSGHEVSFGSDVSAAFLIELMRGLS